MLTTSRRRTVETLTLVRVQGRLTSHPDHADLDEFRRQVDALAADAVDVALDLSGVEAIDSEGVGELARALGRVSRRGGRLALIAPTHPVRRVLAVTRLDRVFHVLSSEDAAIEVLVRGAMG